MRESSKHLQDTLLTKLLGQFIELHNNHFFQKEEHLTWDCIVLFFLQHFEKLQVNIIPESIYMEKEFGLKKYT